MTDSTFDAYRPPEQPKGRRRRSGPARDGRTGPGRDGSGPGRGGASGPVGSRRRQRMDQGEGTREVSLAGDMQFSSYYDQPIVKAPPWGAPIAVYLFTGGMAGALGVIQLAAEVTQRPRLRRNARLVSLGALGVGTAALIEDLGRPERFLNMMRVVKLSSPMSLGTWILTGYGLGAGMAGANEIDRMLAERLPLAWIRPVARSLEAPAAAQAAVFGAPLAAYTAALLGSTSVPTWQAAGRGLGPVFVSSAAAAASGAMLITTPVREAAPMRWLAPLAAIADVVGSKAMKDDMHELEREPLETGAAGRKLGLAEKLVVAGGAVAMLAGRWRPAAIAGGAMLVAGSVLTRFGVLEAGLESTKDPRRVVIPQKERLAKRRARGITDDSITTAG